MVKFISTALAGIAFATAAGVALAQTKPTPIPSGGGTFSARTRANGLEATLDVKVYPTAVDGSQVIEISSARVNGGTVVFAENGKTVTKTGNSVKVCQKGYVTDANGVKTATIDIEIDFDGRHFNKGEMKEKDVGKVERRAVGTGALTTGRVHHSGDGTHG